MRKLTESFPAKAAAFILAVVCLLVGAASAVGVAVLADSDYYFINEEVLCRTVLNDRLEDMAYDVVTSSLYSSYGAKSEWPAEDSNIRLRVRINDTVLENTYQQEDFSLYTSSTYDLYSLYMHELGPDVLSEAERDMLLQIPGIARYINAGGSPDAVLGAAGESLAPNGLGVTVELWLVQPMTVSDNFSRLDALVRTACGLRGWLAPIAAVCLLAGLIFLIFLFCAAGHRADASGIVLNPLDRIPLDIYLALFLGLELALAVAIAAVLDGRGLIVLRLLLLAACGLVMSALLLGAVLSIAARAKAGGMFKNTLLWRILRPVGLALRWGWRKLCYAVSAIPLMWKTALGLTLAVFLDFFLTMSMVYSSDGMFRYLAIKLPLLALAVLYTAHSLRQLQGSIRRMADGDLNSPVDTRGLTGDFRRSGEDLGRIRDGMNSAVEERMKSERLKTELITNVSHDIKTPLTSIINYVDLIKKQEPTDETLKQYIEVLDRQSTRLKKLIEDLIEASKASSGALATHPEPCELGVLLAQVCGEFSEKLQSAGLTVVTQAPEEPVVVLADGRHLWRVFDNLMNNICKYAQSGTRVYLALKAEAGQAVVSFRNISREALNISGEELMERFVRGDRSRHTEGSGLGLSIARSLTELQGGRLQLEVDGDLFKVLLTFPLGAPGAAAAAT